MFGQSRRESGGCIRPRASASGAVWPPPSQLPSATPPLLRPCASNDSLKLNMDMLSIVGLLDDRVPRVEILLGEFRSVVVLGGSNDSLKLDRRLICIVALRLSSYVIIAYDEEILEIRILGSSRVCLRIK